MANEFAKHNIKASKKLGQNFLIDQNISAKIINQIPDPKNSIILEVGPGMGSLTERIIDSQAKKIIVLEYDKRCIDYLNELSSKHKNLIVINDDALKAKELDFINENFTIVSNLPYNISVLLLLKWLQIIPHINAMILMFQKEVAERIAAKPRTKSYGVISVFVQYLCNVSICFDVSPQCFHPAPKVVSSVIKITPKEDVQAKLSLYPYIQKICNKAFNQRRKMLRNSLKDVFVDHESSLKEANISADMRPEELSVDDFIKLAKILEQENHESIR